MSILIILIFKYNVSFGFLYFILLMKTWNWALFKAFWSICFQKLFQLVGGLTNFRLIKREGVKLQISVVPPIFVPCRGRKKEKNSSYCREEILIVFFCDQNWVSLHLHFRITNLIKSSQCGHSQRICIVAYHLWGKVVLILSVPGGQEWETWVGILALVLDPGQDTHSFQDLFFFHL